MLPLQDSSEIRYSIVIPCYNEAENLEELVRKIEPLAVKYSLEFILVENGSKDESRYVFQKSPKLNQDWLKKVYVNINRGYGYGLQKGLKVAKGDYVGWIHADMQVKPEDLQVFLGFLEKHYKEKDQCTPLLFLKGKRKNRKFLDRFFTGSMSIFESILFRCCLYDIGAIPVIFSRDLLQKCNNFPNDFSIELYVYLAAVKNGYKILRQPVILERRNKGESSWNKGVYSKIRQSKRIICDSLKIKKGRKVL